MSSFTTPRADFFGKDQLAFFIGQVEDVNDPKLSGRVRVRCVGWHPKDKVGKDSLATEDLPWAHVAMPTTHSQLGGAGGKHGLLPGSWVIGFFFDGEEGQQPIVINSFNFTARATTENLKYKPKGTDGKLTKDDPSFSQPYVPKNYPNISLTSNNPELDPSKVTPPTDAISDCGTNDSVASTRRMKEGLSTSEKGNPESQIYDVTLGDGLCGSISQAKDAINKILAERMPSQFSRYIYNDVVWSIIDGNYIDLNGLTRTISIQIANNIKQTIQASKSIKEEANRKIKATSISIPDRDGMLTLNIDKATTDASDIFNGIFATSFIDKLPDIVLALLQQINNDSQGESGGNYTGNIGLSPNTNIDDWGSESVTETILDTLNTLTDIAIENSSISAENLTTLPIVGEISGILSSLIGGMAFPLTQKFTQYTDIFNSAGDMSLDIVNKSIGCIPSRSYNSVRGSSKYNSIDNYANVGFGGYPGVGTGSGTPTVSEDATINPVDKQLPNGIGGSMIALPLPSEFAESGLNYINGTPNVIIITEPGQRYFYNNTSVVSEAFPSIYIPGYKGTPIPVVDPVYGELVSVITNSSAFDPAYPNPPVSIVPDKSPVGIRSDDVNYDLVIVGIFIQNMGFEYSNATIEVWDRDRNVINGELNPLVIDGHIVNVEVINNGRGFKRIPELRILDNNGYGAVLYPIMSVVAKSEAKPLLPPVEVLFCPGKNQENIVTVNRTFNKPIPTPIMMQEPEPLPLPDPEPLPLPPINQIVFRPTATSLAYEVTGIDPAVVTYIEPMTDASDFEATGGPFNDPYIKSLPGEANKLPYLEAEGLPLPANAVYTIEGYFRAPPNWAEIFQDYNLEVLYFGDLTGVGGSLRVYFSTFQAKSDLTLRSSFFVTSGAEGPPSNDVRGFIWFNDVVPSPAENRWIHWAFTKTASQFFLHVDESKLAVIENQGGDSGTTLDIAQAWFVFERAFDIGCHRIVLDQALYTTDTITPPSAPFAGDITVTPS